MIRTGWPYANRAQLHAAMHTVVNDRRSWVGNRVYVVGDIHGQMERLAALLYSAGLVTQKGDWLGGSARLLFLGDFFDRVELLHHGSLR